MTKILPKPKYHRTPRPIAVDAYTAGGRDNESRESAEKSVYYVTARKFPHDKFPALYHNRQDTRIVFAGLQRIIDRLLMEPITHEELDQAADFFRNRKATSQGLVDFDWHEDIWRRVVDEFDGYVPIRITAMPEGSVVYPHEPIIRIESLVDGMGILAAWFESTLLHVWAATSRLTACRHWLEYYRDMARNLHNEWTTEQVNFFASLMMHDFGARAANSNQENEDIPYMQLYCFGGTDTFEAAYQAFCNGAPDGVGTSVKALAHRNVQSFQLEVDCYNQMFNKSDDNEFLSMVADCYDFYKAVERMLLPLAIESSEKKRGIVVVARPDSGDALEQILWTLQLAVKNGLYTENSITGLKSMTTLRLIEGDSMRWHTMKEINQSLIDAGFDPFGCLIYGVGGGQRNGFTRDDMSFKYAICAVGKDRRPVIKLSEVEGKRTLPEVHVIRTQEALDSGITLILPSEDTRSEDAHVVYYDGLKETPFGPGFTEDFATIQHRVLNEFDTMPLSAGRTSNSVREVCGNLIQRYKAEGMLT